MLKSLVKLLNLSREIPFLLEISINHNIGQ